ncbi:MAG: triple tyrosine motif-containing protein [Cyclobacteriaceae bacterium]
MRNLITCWLVCLCAISLRAQEGSYFLSHHSPSQENFDNICFDIAQDNNGIMYYAMKAGVLEFDGREWDLIPGAGAIYALNRNDAGELFWVGAKGFGKIGFDRKGFKELQYLSDSTVTDVFQTIAIGDEVYFLSENKIFLYRNGEPKAEVIISGNYQSIFTGMFDLFGVVYVQTERNTTFKVENKKLVYVNLNFSGIVLFYSRIDDTYVLGTSDSRVYSCEKDLIVRPVPIKDQPYADANVVISGTWVNRQLLALGTLRGGVMLINPITGERDQIIDYSTGLPDNEVFSLMADANQNIWVAHEYGFTQISPSLPFRSFSYFAGLEGNMLCAYSYRNNVYVGTSLGLFKLDKDEIFDEIISYVDVEIKPRNASNVTAQSQPPAGTKQPQVQEETPSKKRGIFNFLRRNRGKEKGEEEGESTQQNSSDGDVAAAGNQPDDKNLRKEKRIDKVLRSSQHVFKKVAGIDSKITHLVEMDGKLVAAGLEGIFEINNLVAQPITHSPTRYIYASPKQHTVIASTYNDEIWSLHSSDGWQQLNLINSLGDQIDFIFEGAENEWWLCGLDRIYQLQLNAGGIQRLQTIALSNPNFEKTVGLYFNDQIIFVNTDGFYRFEREKNRLNKIDSLPKPSQYFAIDGHILYRDQHRWNMFGDAEGPNNLQLLNLFQNLRFITTDQNPQNLWMISGSNELLKFNADNLTLIQSKFPIFIKSVQNNSVKIADFSHIEIDQENSAVTFEVVQPDFINPKSIEFRFFLDGLHQDWSEWSSANNKINFPWLPPGQYNLLVQARNIFGKISELTPLPFEVTPPYWKTPLFYALEFIIFASLVILSFKLSTRYRIISRFLSLITIILLIEFIQTVIGSSIVSDDTPVVEFIIQVVVAILILPVEGFLRNLMLRSLNSSGKLYRFISPAGEQPLVEAKPPRKRKVKEPL